LYACNASASFDALTRHLTIDESEAKLLEQDLIPEKISFMFGNVNCVVLHVLSINADTAFYDLSSGVAFFL